MRKPKVVADENAELRRRAEKRLKGHRPPKPSRLSDDEALRLVHELEVRQLELEMQNQELRRSRVEIEAGYERYAALFDFAPIGYATLGADGTIREINHVGAQLLNGDRSQLLGKRFHRLVSAGHVCVFDSFLKEALAGEKNAGGEVSLSRGRETPRQLRLWVAAPAGAERLILLAFDDVTELRVKDARLASTEEALREASQRKDEFLAALSHELRNPLAPILNSIYVLAHVEPGSEQAHNAQTIIQRQVAHLMHLIDELLDVTRITRGRISLQRRRVELGDLVRRIVEDYVAPFETCGIRLESCVEPGESWVDADPVRLTQVFTNLLSNAQKFTPRGGNVVVTLRRKGPRVAVLVRDTGVGIAPEVLRHLFEPFAQAPQTVARVQGGLGLGLAMAKGLVELHGGTVAAESKGPGRGSEFTVWMPLAPAPAAPAPAAQAAAPPARRVLVIEDNRDSADSLKEVLVLCGHEVRVAYDGPSGLALARTFRPEFVLCDIGLPGMTGYEVARALRNEAALKNTRLIALSGYAQPADLECARDAGFDQHVPKPPSFETLERLLAGMPVAAMR